jgi:formylglycine-generating enzyme required for sulfatase activity
LAALVLDMTTDDRHESDISLRKRVRLLVQQNEQLQYQNDLLREAIETICAAFLNDSGGLDSAIQAAMALQQRAREAPKLKDGPLGMKFVPLPKATFWVGGGGGNPGKKTEIKEEFEIAIHTVTQGQWQEVMGNNPSWFSRDGEGKDKVKDIKDEDLKHFPVEMVSWNDAQAFIKKLNKKEKGKGYAYRLPSEAEWEYALRGGSTSVEDWSYPYTDRFYLAEPTNHLSSRDANFDGNEPGGNADKGPNLGRTAKVGSYAPNEVGLYDMHGNVAQLGLDLDGVRSVHVVLGTSWDAGAYGNYTAAVGVGVRDSWLGFRLVRVAVR